MNEINTTFTKYPEFLRLPRPGERCLLTGLSRTTLNELIAAGHVEVKRIKKRGNTRGITLIVTDSLLSYLHSQD